MSILNKDKAPVSINGIKAYSKEVLSDKIRRLTIANVQLMIDKMESEKIKINLEVNRARLFGEKNSLVTKREKLRTEIITLNAVNILIRSYQDPFLKPI